MAKRKETPDILAQIMNGEAEPATAAALAEPAAPRKTAATSTAARRPRRSTTSHAEIKSAGRPASRAADRQWEYRLVTFQYHLGWRLRFIDGVEVPDWMGSPRLHEFLSVAGNDRWELVSATSGQKMFGREDSYQLFFRRQAG
jgi:hypothetical protein